MMTNINHLKSNLSKSALAALLLTVTFFNAAGQTPGAVSDIPKGRIEKYDSALDAIVRPTAKIEVIASGFEWSEGPVWVEREKMLLASDVMKNTVYKWTAAKGKEVYLEQSGYTQSTPRGQELGSNGLALDPQGRLVLAQHGDRRIARMDAPIDKPKAKYTVLASTYEGKRFNSPNDLTISKHGDVYFTDPPYGFEKGINDPAREISFHGVYRITADGKVKLMTDTLSRPNGIALFPDGKRLIVANSDSKKPVWYLFDLDKNGDLQNGRIFHDGIWNGVRDKGVPDGLKIDPKGNVFATGPGGIWIFNSQGKPLGRIRISGRTSNVAFGSKYKTLFVTADDYLVKIEL